MLGGRAAKEDFARGRAWYAGSRVLVDSFIQRFQGDPPADRERLEADLRAAVARAREANPGLALDEAEFVAHLAAKVSDPSGLATLRVEDLWLACAASQGDAPAAERVSELVSAARPALARFRRDRSFEDEVLQRVRERVLAGKPARIGDYGGRGDLGRFLRAVALRIAIDLTRGAGREVSDDDALERRAIPADDPELAHMRQHYATEFRAAMREALAALEPSARNALRLYYVDGLTLEDLGSYYGVVPSTVWRRLGSARKSVLEETRRILRERLHVGETELESVLRLIESRLELPESVFDETAK